MSKHIDAELGLAYLDGRLDAARRAKLERHLADCPVCQEELRQHQAVHGRLQSAATQFNPQSGLIPAWEEVRQRRRPFQQRQLLPIVAVMAAVAIILIVELPALWPSQPIEPAAIIQLTQTAVASLTPSPTLATEPTRLPLTPVSTVVEVVVEETIMLPTPTPQSTLIPTDTPAPTLIGLSAPLLSRQGQLAFIHDQVLYVETEPGSGEFAEIGQNMFGTWAPDGSKMLLGIRKDQPLSVEIDDFQIWFVNRAETLSFKNTMDSFPDTIYPYTQYWWVEDGSKIIFIDLSGSSEQPEQTSFLGSTLSLVDLSQNEFKIIAPVKFHSELVSTTPDSFTVMSYCGSPCAKLVSYDNEGNTVWESWETFGSISISSISQFAIDVGRSTIESPNGVIDEINLISGEVKTIWQTSETENLLPPLPSPLPHISPDGNFIAFHLLLDYDAQTFRGVPNLMIIDRDGRSYGTRENSQLLDWRPDGGPVVVQTMDDGKNQLVYWPLTGASAARIFVLPRDFRFVSGKWSADGRTFIYNALDDSIGASYLYLWQPESGIPELIHSAASTSSFDNFAWMPDGSRVYFNLGHEELWSYEPETAELSLIATTQEANAP